MVEHNIEAEHSMIFGDPTGSDQNCSLGSPNEGSLKKQLYTKTYGHEVHKTPFRNLSTTAEIRQSHKSQQDSVARQVPFAPSKPNLFPTAIYSEDLVRITPLNDVNVVK
jgi:hypothetical protein